jgi:hypothetical protein
MFVLGLIVALVLVGGGLVLGTYIQHRASWPWK